MRRQHKQPDGGILPSGYTQLEYLQGTGTQYINTGVGSSSNTESYRIVIDFAWDDYSTYQAMGFGNSGNGQVVRVGHASGIGIFYTAQRTGSWVTVSCNVTSGSDWHQIDLQDYDQQFDGVQLSSRYIGPWNRQFYLFAFNPSWSGTSAFCKCKIKSTQIIDSSNVTVREYIPALRTSDSKPGLYDIINNVFYTNAGTGEFSYA